MFMNLLFEFLFFSIVTWMAGIWLARTTDAIDAKYKLGSAFGGLLILGVATSLPEIAIVVSAAFANHYDIIVGTLLGGIAIQTVVISLLDARMTVKFPLTSSAASLTLVLEGVMVILIVVTSIMAIKTPILLGNSQLSLSAILIFFLWLGGLWLIYSSRKGLPWRAEAIDGRPGREHHQRMIVINHPFFKNASSKTIFSIFVTASIATLIAGVGLESTSMKLAQALGMNSGLFAATFIALVGALPNISTGFSSIDLGDYKLAISDIFGGNAFMPALFIICNLIAGHSILAHASSIDIWFAALGVLLTCIYIMGLILRPKKLYFRMGIDSILVIIVYTCSIIALMFAQ